MKVERANRITAFGERLEKREKKEREGGGGMYGVFHGSYDCIDEPSIHDRQGASQGSLALPCSLFEDLRVIRCHK